MAGRLCDKVCLITGAASGIGKASALSFAREGAILTLADVSPEGEQTVRMVRDCGGRADFILCDIADPAQVEALIDAIVDRHGRLDCAFNNAGIEGPLTP